MTAKHHQPPRTKYTVSRHAGAPAFHANDRPVTLPSYCACAPGWGQPWIDAHKRFVAHGRTIFWLMPTGGYNGEWGTSPFWTEPGQIHKHRSPCPTTTADSNGRPGRCWRSALKPASSCV